jgi:hypothetical protein
MVVSNADPVTKPGSDGAEGAAVVVAVVGAVVVAGISAVLGVGFVVSVATTGLGLTGAGLTGVGLIGAVSTGAGFTGVDSAAAAAGSPGAGVTEGTEVVTAGMLAADVDAVGWEGGALGYVDVSKMFVISKRGGALCGQGKVGRSRI